MMTRTFMMGIPPRSAPLFSKRLPRRFSWGLVPTIPHRAVAVLECRWKFLAGQSGALWYGRDPWFWISPFYEIVPSGPGAR